MKKSSPPKTTTPYKNCIFEICKSPIESFKKSTDGREWKLAASNRKTLAVQLASFGDADGTSIRPSTYTLAEQTGFCRRKVCYLLDDLQELGFLQRTGRHGQRGAAIRKLVIPEKPSETLTRETQTPAETPPLRVQDSILRVRDSFLRVQDSRSESAPAIAHNLPYGPASKPALPPAKQSAVCNTDELREGMAGAFSKARPSEKLNWNGFAEIEALADELGNDTVCKIWKRWLKTRDTGGVKFHLKLFGKEFEATRAGLKRQEAEAIEFEAIIAATRAADDAKTAAENRAWEAKRAEDERQRQADAAAIARGELPF